jgi:hypothetical protein
MPTILKTKNSVTTTVVPTTLQQGELAVNITDKKLWVGNAATTPVQLLGAGVTGDVVGPASATDNAISRFDATTGKLIQNSLVTVSDTGAISAPVDASISGLTVGKGGSAIGTNTAVGDRALNANTTGSDSVAVGTLALFTNTTGASNSAVGRDALRFNTTGGSNTALGNSALLSNTTASNNTAVGYQAGYSNTTGTANTYLGRVAGYTGSTASANTMIGMNAGFATTASNNTFVGATTGTSNTTGQYNIAVGGTDEATVFSALRSNTTGSFNTVLGAGALGQNTTASNNTAVGYQAGYSNTTNADNTYIGRQAAYNAVSQQNVIIGSLAGFGIVAQGGQTIVGYQAGYSNVGTGSTLIGYTAGYNSTGTQNTFVGSFNGTNGCGYLMTTGSDNTILGGFNGNQGGLDIRTASNHIVLSDGDGNPKIYHTSAALYVQSVDDNTPAVSANVCVASNGGISRATSALKYKQDVRDLPSIDINKFRPVVYKSKCENDDQTKDYFGFIADEVDEAGIKELVQYGAEGEIEGFSYDRMTAVLVKAIQELKAEVDSLKQQLGK